MAHQLIEGLAADWDPDKYTDEYRAIRQEIIEAKRRHIRPELESRSRRLTFRWSTFVGFALFAPLGLSGLIRARP